MEIKFQATAMRRLRYRVAMSLDGYIAGSNGEYDWITVDPEIDFAAIFSQFDTILVGRKSYEGMVAGAQSSMPGMNTIVFSSTLKQADYPGVKVIADAHQAALTELKAKPGKDIWLFGGGTLFRSLAEQRLVDSVEVSIIPVLLGAGVPLLPNTENRIKLSLTSQKVYKTGIISLEYRIGLEL